MKNQTTTLCLSCHRVCGFNRYATCMFVNLLSDVSPALCCLCTHAVVPQRCLCTHLLDESFMLQKLIPGMLRNCFCFSVWMPCKHVSAVFLSTAVNLETIWSIHVCHRCHVMFFPSNRFVSSGLFCPAQGLHLFPPKSHFPVRSLHCCIFRCHRTILCGSPRPSRSVWPF